MQFTLNLSETSKEPMYIQVYESIRQAILEGRLLFGERLPSTREVADSFNISRFTVVRAYELLTAQGLVETMLGSGAFVARKLPLNSQVAHAVKETAEQLPAVELSTFGKRIMSPERDAIDTELYDELHYSAPSIDDLPLRAWREVLNKCARFQDKTLFQYVSDPMGYAHLRDALSVYCGRVRTTKGGADRVAIFSGAQPALDLICRLLLNPGDCVAVENPGSLFPRRTFKMHQAQIIPIPVDKNGIIVEELEKIQSKIKFVYVTPAHQDPTGASLSMQRRFDLLDWAKANGAFIIEDDFDNEYSYGDKPHPALQGLDTTGDTVIFQSSFWKVLYPVVRIGFLILPRPLIEPVRQAKGSIERDLPLLEHVALTEFINSGLLERQIKRLKTRYVRRRAALSHVLARKFRDFVTTGGVSSGMHMILHFDNRLDETDILASATDAKVPLVSTKGHYLGEGRTHEYMIDFAHSDESELADIVEDWADKLLSTLIQH